ncbi:MAG: hypothetical protein F6J97_03105, partial [Leptolyngbya sp. SIO4C1]|nr:hypothetical protein [Leptolyngbya sp. SIO4C1]
NTVKALISELQSDPDFINALNILNGRERQYQIESDEDGLLTFQLNLTRVANALVSPSVFSRKRDQYEKMLTQKTIDAAEVREFRILLAIRQWFESFIGGLEQVEILLKSRIIGREEAEPYIKHWIQCISDANYPYGLPSAENDRLQSYILSYRPTLSSFFERFGYLIQSSSLEDKVAVMLETDKSRV